MPSLIAVCEIGYAVYLKWCKHDPQSWLVNGIVYGILFTTFMATKKQSPLATIFMKVALLIAGWWFGTFGIIIPTDFHIFQRGRSTTSYCWVYPQYTSSHYWGMRILDLYERSWSRELGDKKHVTVTKIAQGNMESDKAIYPLVD